MPPKWAFRQGYVRQEDAVILESLLASKKNDPRAQIQVAFNELVPG
jgi:hypothetical protein